MYWTKFELKNIQKHSDLTINLVDGLNVFIGRSGRGKSAIIRGFKWLNGYSEDIQKEGTKNCSFTAYRNDGVIIKRIKSASKNRYEIHINKEEPDIYDKFGKDAPQEILELLGTTELIVDKEKLLLNFQAQREPYFFLGEKPSFRMKVLNRLTGIDIIDRTIHSFNKDMFAINKDYNTLTESIKQKEEELNTQIKSKNEKENQLNKLKLLYTRIEKIESIISKINLLKEKQKLIYEINLSLSIINVLSDSKIKNIESNVNKLKKIENLITKYNKTKQNINLITNKIQTLKTINNIEEIEEKFKKYSKCKLLIDKYNNIQTQINNIKIIETKEIDIDKIEKNICNIKKIESLNKIKLQINQINNKIIETTEQINNNEIQYKECVKQMGICPICQQNITQYCIDKIKL